VCGFGLVGLVVARNPLWRLEEKNDSGHAGYIFVDFLVFSTVALQLHLHCRVAMETQPRSIAELWYSKGGNVAEGKTQNSQVRRKASVIPGTRAHTASRNFLEP
jgi:hypothetical protein